MEAEVLSPEVVTHLAGCAACRVERLLLRAGPPAAPSTTAEGEEPAATDDGAALPAAPRYELGERIGSGGTAWVHRALDLDLHRSVALKLLRREGPSAQARFLAEAQVTAQLDHPYIVPVFHVGATAEGRPYVAERQVHGQSLTEAVRAGLLPTLEGRVEVLRKVCAAVAYAHSRGVLHRDLKPDNVMVGAFGEVQVVDWGLARPLGHRPGPDDVEAERFDSSDDHTRDGTILGTPAWMSPEQARGEVGALDERTDVYALGAMLFFLAVDRPPVEAGAGQTLVEAVARGQARGPAEVDRRVPREIDAIARRALAPDPADRYASVPAMLEDLTAWAERRPLPHVGSTWLERLEKVAARQRTAVRAVAGTVALALVIAGVGGWRYLEDTRAARDAADAEAARARSAERQAILEAASAEVALADMARLDGRPRDAAARLDRATRILEAVGGYPRYAGWARSALVAAAPPPVSSCAPLPATGLRSIAIAPDATAAVALGADGSVGLWDPAGCQDLGRDRVGGPVVDGAAAWLADGPAVIAWIGDSLVHLRPGQGVVARSPLPPALLGPGGAPDRRDLARLVLHPWGEGAVAAPDGQWWTFRFGDPALHAGRPWPDRPRELRLVAGGRAVFAYVGAGHIEDRGLYDRRTLRRRGPCWSAAEASADGRRALINTCEGTEAVDLVTGRRLWSTPETPYGDVGVAPGDHLAWYALGGAIQLFDLDNGAVVGRVVAPPEERLAAVSRDARMLLTTGEDGRVSAWLRTAPRLQRLAREVAAERGPRLALSPDGRLLAAAGVASFRGVEVLDLATGVRLRSLPTGDLVNDLAFSPDGAWLVASTPAGALSCWDLATGQARWQVALPPSEVPVAWVGDEVATVDEQGALVMLDGATGQERRRWPALPGPAVDLLAVPATRELLMGGYLTLAPTALRIDVDDGRVLQRLDSQENRAQLALSPDGSVAALAGWTGRSALWDLSTGRILHTLAAESGPTIGAAFSPGGDVVVTSGWDEQLVFWDARTGARLRSVSLGRKGGFTLFTPDGSLLVHTWSWKVEEVPLDAHVRHARAVADLAGGGPERARAFAALGWWERVTPEPDRGEDDPLLRVQAALAMGRGDLAALAAKGLPVGPYRSVIENLPSPL
ncbi:serine/threonine-protein kinase [Myxococcota bacterium]|nr:serine/threonine-protein kinase [Myxococcota bacterium]